MATEVIEAIVLFAFIGAPISFIIGVYYGMKDDGNTPERCSECGRKL